MMLKRLCTILLSAAVAVPMMWGQSGPGKGGASFAPKKGQWEFSLMLGSGSPFYNDNITELLSTGVYTSGTSNYSSSAIGLPNGSSYSSGQLDGYLNISGFNDNKIGNILGIQAKYFFFDEWAANLSFGMNIGATPKKDYIEGEYYDLDLLQIPAQRYVNAQVNNNWYLNIGADRYFKTRNERIHPYVGATIGMQMARIHTKTPYTGATVLVPADEQVSVGTTSPDTEINSGNTDDLRYEESSMYIAPGKIGQMIALRLATVAGIEYSLTPGMFLAIECQPIAYRYDIIQIAYQGFDNYNLCHHNFKLIDMPIVKIGFRF